MKRNTFLLYCDHAAMIEKLTDEQAGVLFKNLHAYCGTDKKEPNFNGDNMLDIVFTAHKTLLDKDIEAYSQKCKNNKKIADDRWKEFNKLKGKTK